MPPKYRVRRSYMEWMLDPQKRGMKKGYKCAVMRDVTPKNEPKRRFKSASIKRCAKYKGTRGPYTNKTPSFAAATIGFRYASVVLAFKCTAASIPAVCEVPISVMTGLSGLERSTE